MIRILLIYFFFLTPAFADESCEKWFLRADLKPNTKDCEMNCSITMVDMDTFTCPNQCDILCKTVIPEKALIPLAYMQGLTEGDKKAIAKYPKEAVKVYLAKQKADDLTEKIFGKPSKNDESDAFRHFVWSALLVSEIGAEKAEFFLTAHEQEPTQPKLEREMDLANNRRGINFASSHLKSHKLLELDVIETAALTALKENKLSILNPSNKKIPNGYYSK